MRATAADTSLARACGIDTERMVDVAWAISGSLCGLAGVTLVANTYSFDSTTGSAFGVVIIAAVMLGGVGQPYGAMLGAVIIGLVTEISAVFIDPGYKNVVAFLILVAVLVFVPRGIFGRAGMERELAG
jgi:branched-subunit amino acid ABC-type transport system permease component